MVGRVCPRHRHLGRPLNSVVRQQMEAAPRGYWHRMGWIAIGVIVGVFVALWLRVMYYEWAQLHPNMAPQIAYYFAPLFVVVLLVIAAALEAVFSKWWYTVPTRKGNVLVGIGYGLTVLALIPAALVLFVVVIPIVVRWVVRRGTRNESSAV